MLKQVLAIGGSISLLLSLAATAGDKLPLCHVPPGNPANAHTIYANEHALEAHLRHGDTLGACEDEVFVGASANLFLCDDPDTLVGFAALQEIDSDEGIKQVKIRMVVRGLSPGKHALHVHEAAECMPCGAAGGHFDPGPAGDTSPDGNHPFHSGDLVNIRVKENGVGRFRTRTTRFTLSPGPLSIFDEDGSAFIVHVDSDTYCPDGEPGCAGGSRLACGIIELVESD